jgi:cysteinyl-tRNA synthetase
MKLYNTLSRSPEEIRPISPPTVTVYTCGPTVYDYPHVGNWFTFVRYDILVRTLKLAGFTPKWVMNITDVGHLVSDMDDGEDKLQKGARREGKTAQEIASFYSNYFIEGMKRLNFTRPAYLPKATDHIPEQIDLIKRLEAKGYTYTIDDGVYYDISKFPRYADFARLDLDELQAGRRAETNPQKRNLSDFALWKFSPVTGQRDMEWDSPWGVGFPGWHLECSAMSMKYLGETMDIHAGGIDHLPVHHTNEIAQSEAATGKPFAHYWMHTNHIMVEGEKISKSLGNSITLEDIEGRGISLMALRLHILESHYRSQSKFSWESLEGAENRLRNIKDGFTWIYNTQVTEIDDTMRKVIRDFFEDYKSKIKEALFDDLDTPAVLAALSKCANELSTMPISQQEIGIVEGFTSFIDDALGIKILVRPLSPEQLQLIVNRDAARRAKNWTKSDQLRDQLAKQGIGLRDTEEHGTIWYRLWGQ